MTTMKKILYLFLAITITSTLLVACNSNPKVNNEDVARKVADSLRLAADTAGLSQFQAWKAQNELWVKAPRVNRRRRHDYLLRARRTPAGKL